jgi:diguanylate cyclase (GGDEF)-like protein
MRSILQILVSAVNDNERLSKYSQQAKTIISILSDINSEFTIKNIYQIVVDAVIFLFDIDTASIFLRTNGHYSPAVIEGRNSRLIKDLKISENNRLLAKAHETDMPVSMADSHELLHTGFSEEITSIHLFPFSSRNSLFGLLVIINSSLDRVTRDAISDMCKLIAYLCEVRQMKDEYENKYAGYNKISTMTTSLFSLYRDPSRLYDGIVNEASVLANAEKCSLMMSDDNEMLEIRAVKGVNPRFMENVKVRRGEGIAGRVFESGSPILINGEAEIKEYGNSPRSHYKTLSSLSMPLKVEDEMIGVLNLSDKSSGAPFTQNDISMLTPFVIQASTLLKLGSYHETLEEVTKLSITDSLTGLFNRRYLDIRLEEEYLRAKRYHLILSLTILDIDDFKLFNDSEGHLAGDHILIEIARVMSGTVRSHDILARFGGEEFAIIMPQTTKAEAFVVSERIRENIKRHIRPTWKRYQKKQITLCSGIATYPECGAVKEDIIRYADRALYKAKKLGKDRTVTWE